MEKTPEDRTFFAYYNLDADYRKLANVYSICRSRNDSYNIDHDLAFRQIFRRDSDSKINYRVPLDSPVRHHSPELLGFTALHFAVRYSNDVAILDSLLRLGADITSKNSQGFTPLRLCLESSYGRQRHCCGLKGTLAHPLAYSLLGRHALDRVDTNPRCNDGISHFHIACMFNHVDAVDFFVRNGVAIDEAVSLNSKILPGYTGLHFAARYCSVDVIRLLLSHGASRTSMDAKWMTPLHLLLEFKIQLVDAAREKNWKSFDGLRSDLKKIDDAVEVMTAGVDDPSMVLDDTGLTLLHVICSRGKTSVESYLERIEDVDAAVTMYASFCPGYTPLHFAAHFDIQSLLLLTKQRKANVLAKDARGVTPLDICFGRYNIHEIHAVFASHDSLRQLTLSNDDAIAYVLSLMRDKMLFQIYVSGTIDERMQVSKDSAVWPGYNLLHISVALSKYVQFPQFDDLDHSETTFPIRQDDELVAMCLDHEVDYTTQDYLDQATPLHLAFRQHKRDVVAKIASYCHLRAKSWRDPVDSGNLSHSHLLICANEFNAAKSFCHGRNMNLKSQQLKTAVSWQDLRYVDFNEINRIPGGSTALHTAIILDNVEMVEWVVHQGLDPSAKNHDGVTPLHLVVFKDDKLASLLLKHSRPLRENVTSSGGLSDFHIACYLSNIEAMRVYLEDLQVDVNLPIVHSYRRYRLHPSAEVGFTPLHFAIEGCSLEAVKLLIERGADVQAKSVSGLTPMYLALKNNCVNIVQYLYTLMTRDTTEYNDEMGVTLLHIACACLDEQAVETLLRDGADTSAKVRMNSPIFAGCTPMHALMGSMNLEDERVQSIARMLMDAGEELPQPPNPIDREGISQLHLAVRLSDHIDCRSFILRNVDNLNATKDYFCRDEAGYTALHYAMELGVMRGVQMLLELGADVGARDQSGATPLHCVARVELEANFRAKIKMILRAGKADPNAQDLLGRTPIESLIESNFRPATIVKGLQILLSHGGLINAYNPISSRALLNKLLRTLRYGRNFQSVLNRATDLLMDEGSGRSAIHNLVSTRHDGDKEDWIEIYTMAIGDVMRRGVRINFQDYEGKTALHVAVEYPNYPAIKALLILGADVNITDNDGLTAFYYSKDNEESRRVFEQHLRQLLFVGLEVSRSNETLLEDLTRDDEATYRIDKTCQQELYEMRDVRVYRKSFTLRDFLSERAIVNYPTMPRTQRDAIDHLHRNHDKSLKEFNQLGHLINLQCAKALDRVHMMEAAKDVVWMLMGSEIPEPCVEHVLGYFSNVDLRMLIKLM